MATNLNFFYFDLFFIVSGLGGPVGELLGGQGGGVVPPVDGGVVPPVDSGVVPPVGGLPWTNTLQMT